MQFYRRITLALAIICLFGHSGFVSSGAPTKGRYTWVKCKPEDQNANCVTQMGPLVPLEGKSPRLPRSAVKDIFPVSTEEITPEMEEQSGEGSGNSDTMIFLRDGPEQELNTNEKETTTAWIEASGDIDYSNFVFPEKIDELSEGDLKDENMIP
ncbi:serglycin [Triplophysa rosa]|uniref:Serglycin n=1 Tax=Triplophysa rosa TaxID=992332 RepID=A0A9W8C0S8_TRIRA|nr:serglycin [Triplophysa rosa]KAI7805286.1 serglycin precursor [Triplophysa rosa]